MKNESWINNALQTEISILLHFSMNTYMKKALGRYVPKSTWQITISRNMDSNTKLATRKARNPKKATSFQTNSLHDSITSCRTNARSTCVPPVAIHALLNRNLF
ncbi:hypothetical protein AVEN_173513-1 [Araneus ventricosus]|uniref:Uncharacterized protein n=1 Tax=Araneus ventricosus TaxID=182803 RepID=A0A4Y2MDQ2_ARAVE|nr:hypothetical protein AVEN_173513-1 [Araneus ventricosus]